MWSCDLNVRFLTGSDGCLSSRLSLPVRSPSPRKRLHLKFPIGDDNGDMKCCFVWKPGNWDLLDSNSVQRGTSVSHLYWTGLFKFLVLQFSSRGVDVLCMIQATRTLLMVILLLLYRQDNIPPVKFIKTKKLCGGILFNRKRKPHTMSEKRHEINKFANYQNIIVRNSPAFDRHVFISSQDHWSMDLDVMRMISTQIRWQDTCWSLCKLWEHRLDFI